MTISLKKWLQRFKARPKYQRVLTYLVLVYGVYLILLGGIIPAVLQRQLPEKASAMLGRTVSISEIHINPFLLRVTINHGNIANWQHDSAQPNLFSFEQFQAQFQFWQSLFTLTPTVKDVVLTKPNLHVTRQKGEDSQPEFNFTSIVDKLAENSADDKEESSESQSGGAAFRANRIALVGGTVNYQDHMSNADIAYQGVSFELTHLDLQALMQAADNSDKVQNQLHVMAQGHDGQDISIQGQFQVQPLQAKASFALDNIDLTDFWPFVRHQVTAQLQQGSLSTNGEASFAMQGHTPTYSLTQGRVALSDVLFVQPTTNSIKQADANKESPRSHVGLQNFIVDEIALDSKTQKVTIGSVDLTGLDVRGVLDKQGVDLQRLFTPITPHKPTTSQSASVANNNAANNRHKTGSTEPQAENPSWVVQVKNVHLAGDIALQDKAYSGDDTNHAVTWNISSIAVQLSHIWSDFSRPIHYSWSLLLNNSVANAAKDNVGTGGEFSGKGQVNLATSELNTHVAFKDFNLSSLQPYLQQYMNLSLKQGRFTTEGDVSSQWTQGKATYQGSLAVDQLQLDDQRSAEPLVSWQSLQVDKLSFSQAENRLAINQVTLTKPYAKVIIHKDRTTNLSDIAKTATDTSKVDESSTAPANKEDQADSTNQKATPASQSALPIALTLKRIKVVDGSAYFSDLSLTPNFSSGIRSLDGAITDLSSQGNTVANVNLKGKIDQYAPISLTGKVNPLLEKPYLDLDLNIKSAELTSINSYSGTYAGYFIDKGQLSLGLNYHLDQGKLKGENHVYIDQLTLGKPSDSDLATSLPVKLAIALLQDRNGVIDLGVQVSGDVDDPSFGIGSVIWTAVKNIITKAVTAPFSLLSNLVGSDEELNVVNFAAGQSQLTQEEQERLTTLGKALKQRPQLNVDVAGSINPTADANALAELQLRKTLFKMGVKNAPTLTASYVSSDDEAVDAVEDFYEDKIGKSISDQRDAIEEKLKQASDKVSDEDIDTRLYASLYNQLLNAEQVSPEALRQLSVARAQAVKAFLVNQQEIDPDRIFLLSGRKNNSAKSEVLLTLKPQ
ncbi:DUF748 domain-containing protein [Vibrio nitrifigilis]|uniref:DUF748 domain-containing protein n=1 Tax=Vibrio nitrifigilis TaxID=2789781 RepID=A0ABS0G9E2_9VIBR|nr:DUF748 domain-containing protein [Vibrio nitrifigilis]MBF8999028.1 DUF748 domain-containing protein [Vibrio nitrifigilis]